MNWRTICGFRSSRFNPIHAITSLRVYRLLSSARNDRNQSISWWKFSVCFHLKCFWITSAKMAARKEYGSSSMWKTYGRTNANSIINFNFFMHRRKFASIDCCYKPIKNRFSSSECNYCNWKFKSLLKLMEQNFDCESPVPVKFFPLTMDDTKPFIYEKKNCLAENKKRKKNPSEPGWI